MPTDTKTAVAAADVVIAVPDHILGAVSGEVVPQLRSGAVVLTLDPAAAYAGLLAERDDVSFAVAHPCHPSVFLERTSQPEWADTFGGIVRPGGHREEWRDPEPPAEDDPDLADDRPRVGQGAAVRRRYRDQSTWWMRR